MGSTALFCEFFGGSDKVGVGEMLSLYGFDTPPVALALFRGRAGGSANYLEGYCDRI
jgi:hypothetical protein